MDKKLQQKIDEVMKPNSKEYLYELQRWHDQICKMIDDQLKRNDVILDNIEHIISRK